MPAYTGYLKVNFNNKINKWLPVNNGVAVVTPAIAAGISPGIYPARFRPYIASGTNRYAWSKTKSLF